jgi:DNA-binding response OmpR family regulator
MTRVLYVDDEEDIAEVAAMALELDPDFQVRTCFSGGAAIAEAAVWQPDIILLDVMMPGMDGPTTLGKLRAQAETAQTPIIFITARTQAQEVAALEALGAAGVIAKPFDPMTLASMVRKRLAR